MSGSLNISIRQEEARDVADIRELVDVAFKPMWFSDGTEAELVSCQIINSKVSDRH